MDLKFRAGFKAAEHADQPAAHAILGKDIAGDGFFVHVAGVQIAHGSSESFRFSQGSFLQAFSDLLHMVAKVLKEDLVRPEIAHHAVWITDGAPMERRCPRNTKRSNPESVPAILSWCLAINSCMGRSPPYRSLSLATYK